MSFIIVSGSYIITHLLTVNYFNLNNATTFFIAWFVSSLACAVSLRFSR